jgi:hypothetical protein
MVQFQEEKILKGKTPRRHRTVFIADDSYYNIDNFDDGVDFAPTILHFSQISRNSSIIRVNFVEHDTTENESDAFSLAICGSFQCR